jgi:hypothetical protein
MERFGPLVVLAALSTVASACAREANSEPPPRVAAHAAVAAETDQEAIDLKQFGGVRTESFHEGGRFWTRSKVFVSAPAARVRAVILDYGGYSTIMPQTFQRSKVLRRDGLAVDVYLQADVFDGKGRLWVDEHFAAPVAEGKGETIVATMNKGNVDDASGFWRYRDAEGGTVVTIELSIEPSVPLPLDMVRQEMEGACEHAAQGVREAATTSDR